MKEERGGGGETNDDNLTSLLRHRLELELQSVQNQSQKSVVTAKVFVHTSSSRSV